VQLNDTIDELKKKDVEELEIIFLIKIKKKKNRKLM
jgi:hypothetical protein